MTTPEKSTVTRPASSDTSTEGIRIQAAAQYMPKDSNPDQKQYIFAYRITITNEGTETARLLSRHWVIIDADNHREEVRGEGVVGKQPEIPPGEKFEYTSGCPLRTAWGTMEGTYQMERADKRRFRAQIGRFFLVPSTPKTPSTSKRGSA
jgi:ApaG protein